MYYYLFILILLKFNLLNLIYYCLLLYYKFHACELAYTSLDLFAVKWYFLK